MQSLLTDSPRLAPRDQNAPTLHLAFLGCGRIAAEHARRLASFPNLMCSFASRDPARSIAFAQRLGRGRAYGSYAATLTDATVDAVVITTPTALHLPLTLEALQAGKDVIVEKPAFPRSTDFDQVEAAASASHRRVLVAENYAYKPLAVVLREIVRSGEIGEVRYLTINALKHQVGDGWRGDEVLAGGGALFEGGIHWVNLLSGLGLTPESVQAYRPGGLEGIERSLLVVMQYEEGAIGTLHHAWDTQSVSRGLRISRIYGTLGSVAFESNGLFVLVRGRGSRLIAPGWGDIGGYRAMFADFLSCLRDGQEPRMTLARARRDLELVEAAYRSLP